MASVRGPQGGAALRLQLLASSLEDKNDARMESEGLREGSSDLRRQQFALETEGAKLDIATKGWRAVGEGIATGIQIIGVALAAFTYGISAAVGNIAAAGTRWGFEEAREGANKEAPMKRRRAAGLQAQAILNDKRAERLEESGAANHKMAKSLGEAQTRIQRELRRAENRQV